MSFDYDAPLSADKVLAALATLYETRQIDPPTLYTSAETSRALAETFYDKVKTRITLTSIRDAKDDVMALARVAAFENPATGTMVDIEIMDDHPDNDLSYNAQLQGGSYQVYPSLFYAANSAQQ